MLQRGVEIVNPGLVRLVHYEPVATAERVPQTRPDSPSASDGYAAGLIAIGARPSTADLAALVDEVSW